MSDLAELQEKALSLPLPQRIILAESILASLPREEGEISDEEFREEERRNREIESGHARPLSETELFERVAALRGK